MASRSVTEQVHDAFRIYVVFLLLFFRVVSTHVFLVGGRCLRALAFFHACDILHVTKIPPGIMCFMMLAISSLCLVCKFLTFMVASPPPPLMPSVALGSQHPWNSWKRICSSEVHQTEDSQQHLTNRILLH